MKILYLGPPSSVSSFLQTRGSLTVTSDKITPDFVSYFDWVVSYGYRFILTEEVIGAAKNPILNLHISYLPWNRGANPNFWSWVDKTPKGVTIHEIDSGIDTGPIYIQKEIRFAENETLTTSYNKLKKLIEDLFEESFDKIITGDIEPFLSTAKGSYHSKKDFEQVSHLLVDGWNTPVSFLLNSRPKRSIQTTNILKLCFIVAPDKARQIVTRILKKDSEILILTKDLAKGMKRTDLEIIQEIETIREHNNKNWMDLVRLAFEHAPNQAKAIMADINADDSKITGLLEQLSNNTQ